MARVFTSPPSRLTWDDLQAFLNQALPEGERIDYKTVLNDRVPESIAAMANTEGGIILVGVGENPATKSPAVPPEGVAVEHIGGGTLASLCYARLSPVFVPAHHYVAFPENPQKGILVIQVVPEAAPIPIWVEGKGVLIRIGDQNRPADLPRLRALLAAGESRLKPLREAGEYEIGTALQASAEDRTYVVVGAVIQRSEPQADWSSGERQALIRAVRTVLRFRASEPEVSHSAGALLLEAEHPFIQFSFSARGTAVMLFGWKIDPFPVACALTALLAGVKIIQNTHFRDAFRPIDPIDLTLGLVNWPTGGLHAGEVLGRLANPRPIGPLRSRQASRRYHLAQDSVSWSVIGPFLAYVLAEAGYTRYERELETEPEGWFISEKAEGCGISLREWEDK